MVVFLYNSIKIYNYVKIKIIYRLMVLSKIVKPYIKGITSIWGMMCIYALPCMTVTDGN